MTQPGRSNIILCGFMGSGKTTLGRLLARRLGMEFVDLDDVIAEAAGMSIPEIFKTLGEEGFRDAEHQAALHIADRRGVVLGAGGGTMVYARNVTPLRESGTVVYLDPGFAACYRRIKNSDRPVVRRSTPEELEEIYRRRHEKYKAAAHLEAAVQGSAEACVDELVELLERGL